jgi:hypothetical protein
LGGEQRYAGPQSLMTFEKDDVGWLRLGSDTTENFELAVNTPQRKKAWGLLPNYPFKYCEGERLVKPAMSSASTFYRWLDELVRVKLVSKSEDGHYQKAVSVQCNLKKQKQA